MKGRPRPRLRLASCLAAGSMIVHELRYLAVYGGGAHTVAGHEGHGYLALATPAVGLVLAGLLSSVLVRAAATGHAHAQGTPARRAWLVLSLALLSIYVAQELVEGVLSTGHPDGLGGVFGGGGIVAVPLSLLVASLMALALRGADALERIAAGSGCLLRLEKRVAPATGIARAVAPAGRRPAPVARHTGGRGPPVAV